ncbi:hypothetical protein JHK82_016143 [Glycine max]|nr:hypothetical protein JHK85_016542 [Glycine max]KAG5046766.1 hypothetical protein JHK86_016172 [Glycine max]KAG5149262.1 hypothetical protein JHK82_016143 [Glycine max]
MNLHTRFHNYSLTSVRESSEGEDTITIAANFGWYKPLVDIMIQGPDSRIARTKAIVNLELKDPNLKLLSKEGTIPPLLEMLTGNIESKDLSLSALVKLAGSHANKGITVASG